MSLPFATPDFDRLRRQGAPEAIFGAGKTPGQIVEIARALRGAGQSPILATRIDAARANALADAFGPDFTYDPDGRIGRVGPNPAPSGHGAVAVVTAGTSDIPVAREAIVTAEAMGNATLAIFDVGVAGIDRLLARVPEIRSASVVIAIAGMEGALASVVGGLVAAPVIAVPTSVGYGASLGGVAALLSMVNSCAAGVSVVNIDNGFGAAVLASRINHTGIKTP